MVTIGPDPGNAVEKVYRKYESGVYPLDERGISFVAGYHLTRQEDVTVGFELGLFGRRETSFSPDLDLLSVGSSLSGYEVKGYRGDSETVTKDQLYKGLGQANTLLNQPSTADGGVLQYVWLLIPMEIEADDGWTASFIEAVRETPVGLKRVGIGGVETVVQPDENPFYNPSLQREFIGALREDVAGTDKRHPEQGLENLALDILEQQEFTGDTFA